MNELKQSLMLRRGFTLVELLLVISIMLVLAAMVIPKLRVVTTDRKVREAARVVESMFSTARDTAMVNGFAGVEIVRNKNYANGATSMFRMRMLPPYSGDFAGDAANISGPVSPGVYSVTLPVDASYDPSLNDFIQFNYRGALYRMLSPATFEVLPSQVPPPLGNGIPFRIHRKPIRMFSGEVRLPAGQVIDLRYSGDPDTSGSSTSLNAMLNPTPVPSPNSNSFIIVFDEHGAIERLYPQGFSGPLATAEMPAGPLFLLISEDQDVDGVDPLQNLSNLWVTISQTSGAAKTSEMGSNLDPTALLPARITAARALAMERRDAQQ